MPIQSEKDCALAPKDSRLSKCDLIRRNWSKDKTRSFQSNGGRRVFDSAVECGLSNPFLRERESSNDHYWSAHAWSVSDGELVANKGPRRVTAPRRLQLPSLRYGLLGCAHRRLIPYCVPYVVCTPFPSTTTLSVKLWKCRLAVVPLDSDIRLTRVADIRDSRSRRDAILA